MFTCQTCNRRFTLTPDSACSTENNTCPYCGSREVKKNSFLSFFRGIISSGGG